MERGCFALSIVAVFACVVVRGLNLRATSTRELGPVDDARSSWEQVTQQAQAVRELSDKLSRINSEIFKVQTETKNEVRLLDSRIKALERQKEALKGMVERKGEDLGQWTESCEDNEFETLCSMLVDHIHNDKVLVLDDIVDRCRDTLFSSAHALVNNGTAAATTKVLSDPSMASPSSSSSLVVFGGMSDPVVESLERTVERQEAILEEVKKALRQQKKSKNDEIAGLSSEVDVMEKELAVKQGTLQGTKEACEVAARTKFCRPFWDYKAQGALEKLAAECLNHVMDGDGPRLD